MVEIIPAINSETFEEVREKIRKVEPYVKWVHLDIADGTFTPNTLWHNSLDLVGFQTNVALEIHMMEDDPEERIEHWFLPPVKRIIVHWETVHDMDFIIEECHKEKIEVGLAIADQTSWTKLKPYIPQQEFFSSNPTSHLPPPTSHPVVDMLQVLCVPAGRAGQEFHAHNLVKIKHLRKICPHCIIEVDGGINLETAKKSVEMGANVIAAASYIFKQQDIKKAIEELENFNL